MRGHRVAGPWPLHNVRGEIRTLSSLPPSPRLLPPSDMRPYRAYAQPDDNTGFTIFGLGSLDPGDTKYSKALKSACKRAAGRKPPPPHFKWSHLQRGIQTEGLTALEGLRPSLEPIQEKAEPKSARAKSLSACVKRTRHSCSLPSLAALGGPPSREHSGGHTKASFAP